MALVTENVVVTGTYLPQPEALMTNPVFVIDRSRIEALGKASVVEVLRTVPPNRSDDDYRRAKVAWLNSIALSSRRGWTAALKTEKVKVASNSSAKF